MSEELCMTPNCGKKQKECWKGLCRSCYGQAMRLIEQGETSWEELEKMGMCRLPHKPFTELFKRRKYEKADQGSVAGGSARTDDVSVYDGSAASRVRKGPLAGDPG